jgi:hypothetical protein
MRQKTVTLLLAALCISGCSEAEQASLGKSKEALSVYDAQEAEPATEAAAVTSDAEAKPQEPDTLTDIPSAEIKFSQPQIAYAYEYGYRVSASGIPILQRAHADLCERKGPKICHILNLSQDGSEGEYASGKLEIEVAAANARGFADELSKIAQSKGGEPVSSSIAGEDLSKQIVDTEARLRARSLLRDRLMEILRTRSGKVSELVEAERGVAAVNEEIDQAQSWLSEMKGRVAFSKMTLNYNAGAPSAGGFFEPIRNALGSIGPVLGGTIAAIIYLFIILLPWAALLALLLWVKRKMGWRWRFWRKDQDDGNYSDS